MYILIVLQSSLNYSNDGGKKISIWYKVARFHNWASAGKNPDKAVLEIIKITAL